MNVIFLDFDGVLDTHYYYSNDLIESKIAILADICHEFDCKVVIEASAKDAIDEETLEINQDSDWIKFIFEMFKKYNIECIGRTPNVIKRYNNGSYTSIWKEDEIRLYLFNHPEIDHYCVIDDDDLKMYNRSDLDKVREHLVVTDNFLMKNPEEEGLLYSHKEKIKTVLLKGNEVKKLALKRKDNK